MSTIAENDPYALNPYVGSSFHYLSLLTRRLISSLRPFGALSRLFPFLSFFSLYLDSNLVCLFAIPFQAHRIV